MSALGQRTLRNVRSMSALPQKRTLRRATGMSALCQKRTFDLLVDHLIGSHQHCARYCQAECFQGLFINGETEAGWLLEGEISGARSSQDSDGKVCRAIVNFIHIWAVRHEPAISDKKSIFVNRRQLLLGSELKDPFAVERRQGIRDH